jgi:hypothetical protein
VNNLRILCLALSLIGVIPGAAYASTIITFESLTDGENVSTQFPGLTFTNATILSAGIGLNEFEFPPTSGTNVAFDSAGPIRVAFDTPVTEFGAFFTYLEQVSLQAFDSGDVLVGSASSSFSSNLAMSGDPGSTPNELLQLAFWGGIASVTITGNLSGQSFTMDDLTLTPLNPVPVPEPGTFSLFAIGAAGLGRRWYRRRQD